MNFSLSGPTHPDNTAGPPGQLLCGTLSLFPDELLGEISVHVMQMATAAIDPYSIPSNWCPRGYYRWIVVTQICRRWRQVTLTTPRLWTTITLPCNIAWSSIILERSGQVPLTVIVDDVSSSEEELLRKDMFLRLARRAKHLQINLTDPFSHEVLAALSVPNASASPLQVLAIKLRVEPSSPNEPMPVLLHGPLPHLRHLTFASLSDDDASVQSDDDASVQSDDDASVQSDNDNVIQFGLPLLQQLLLPSLKSLHIHYLETPISVDACLAILATLPNLEDLVFGQVLCAASDVLPKTPSASSHIVHLPHLRSITFNGGSELYYTYLGPEDSYYGGMNDADVLRRLAVPSSAYVSFAIDEENLVGQTLDFVCDILHEIVAGRTTTVLGPPRLPITRCRIILADSDGVRETFECRIELFHTPEGPSEGMSKRAAVQDKQYDAAHGTEERFFSAQFRTNFGDLFDCVESVLGSFHHSLSDVTTLGFIMDIEDSVYMDDGEHYMVTARQLWPCFEQSMPQIRNLYLRGYSTEFVKWLGDEVVARELQEGQTRMLVFPHLQSLAVDGTEWPGCEWQTAYNKLDVLNDSWRAIGIAEPEEYEVDIVVKDTVDHLVFVLQLWSGQFENEQKLRQLTVMDYYSDNRLSKYASQIEASDVARLVEFRDFK